MEGGTCCCASRTATSGVYRPAEDGYSRAAPRRGQVPLQVEPWFYGRRGWHTGRAWRECVERVLGYLDNRQSQPQTLVQQNVICMARQLYSPRSIVSRNWSPEVVERVEALAAKLASVYRARSPARPGTPLLGSPEPPAAAAAVATAAVAAARA